MYFFREVLLFECNNAEVRRSFLTIFLSKYNGRLIPKSEAVMQTKFYHAIRADIKILSLPK